MTEKREKNGTKTQRDEQGRFVAGNSGGGRPKQDPEAKEILKAATPAAAQALVELLKSKREAIRLEAAKEILNRTQGNPETMTKLELTNGNEQGFLIKWITEEDSEL